VVAVSLVDITHLAAPKQRQAGDGGIKNSRDRHVATLKETYLTIWFSSPLL
jgi:hypothetical protein